jgi:hypothetical protein
MINCFPKKCFRWSIFRSKVLIKICSLLKKYVRSLVLSTHYTPTWRMVSPSFYWNFFTQRENELKLEVKIKSLKACYYFFKEVSLKNVFQFVKFLIQWNIYFSLLSWKILTIILDQEFYFVLLDMIDCEYKEIHFSI